MNKDFKKGFNQGVGITVGGGMVIIVFIILGSMGLNTLGTIPCRLIRSGYKLRPRSEFMMDQCKRGSGICVTKFGQFQSAWNMLTAPNWMYMRENSNPFKKCGIDRWSDIDTRY